MDVKHVAKLANLPLSPQEETVFLQQFTDTLTTVDLINQLDTNNIEPTSQVTGLVNITRPDVINRDRVLSQSAALSQAKHTHNGYFVVPAIFNDQ